MPESSVTCAPRINTTPDQARDIRAWAWAFVFECHVNRNAAGVTSTNGDDAKGSLKHGKVRATTTIHHR